MAASDGPTQSGDGADQAPVRETVENALVAHLRGSDSLLGEGIVTRHLEAQLVGKS